MSNKLANFWPRKYLYTIDHDLLRQLSSDYRQWDLARAHLSADHLHWSAGVARCFSYFKDLPYERLAFAHRHCTTTFFMDDVWERSCFGGTSGTFGRAYLSNLANTVRGQEGYIIDLNVFKSDAVTDNLLDSALFAQNILRQNLETGKKVLSPLGYALQKEVILIWFQNLIREESLLLPSQKDGNKYHYDNLMNTRVMTVGYELVLPAILPVSDNTGAEIIRPYHNFAMMGSMVAALDNDLASAPKEQGKWAGDESPMNLLFAVQREDGCGVMAAARKIVNRRNAIVKVMAGELEVCPKRWRAAYTNMLLYALNFSDYEYVSEHGRPNTRYGFTWHRD
jgi:hypothetical protein